MELLPVGTRVKINSNNRIFELYKGRSVTFRNIGTIIECYRHDNNIVFYRVIWDSGDVDVLYQNSVVPVGVKRLTLEEIVGG